MQEQVILHTGLKLRLGLNAPTFSKITNFTNTASFGRSQYDFTELAEIPQLLWNTSYLSSVRTKI